jgi:uncharacterized protein (UPF0128 family)
MSRLCIQDESIKSKVNELERMMGLLLSAISQKSPEIDLWLEEDQEKIKLRHVHAKMTLKELYENIIPQQYKNAKYLVFGDEIFDPFVFKNG